MKIDRTIAGVINFLVDKAEEVDQSTEMATADRIKHATNLLKEARGWVVAGLAQTKERTKSGDAALAQTYQVALGGKKHQEAIVPQVEEVKAE